MAAFVRLRLADLIGTGRSSVQHTRNLAEIYDSDLVTKLGVASGTPQDHLACGSITLN